MPCRSRSRSRERRRERSRSRDRRRERSRSRERRPRENRPREAAPRDSRAARGSDRDGRDRRDRSRSREMRPPPPREPRGERKPRWEAPLPGEPREALPPVESLREQWAMPAPERRGAGPCFKVRRSPARHAASPARLTPEAQIPPLLLAPDAPC